MTRRLPVAPSPAPLEGYAARFDGSHPPPLAVGVLRVLVLLVGIRALAHRRAGRDREQSPPRIGRKGKKESSGVLAPTASVKSVA